MTNRRTTSTLMIAIVVCIGLGAGVEAADRSLGPWIARAVADNPELDTELEGYASPLFIPAADFRTDGLYPEAQSYSLSGYWKGDGLGGVYLIAPVWLPDGVTINSVWLLAVDDDDTCSSDNMTQWLLRVDNYTGGADTMATMSTSGATSNMQAPFEGNPIFPTIEYPDFSYWLTVRVCSLDHQLYGAMIIYD